MRYDCLHEETTRGKIQHYVPKVEEIIKATAGDLSYENVDEEWLVNIYTDGSLLDGRSDHFARAGWGVYIGNGNRYNASGPLCISSPNTFRAELRAIVHVFLHCAIPFIIRSDCKAAVDMVNAIADGGRVDPRHDDADLLEVIRGLCGHGEMTNP